MRAFIFSVTCGDTNTDVISSENFVAGISRFGVENPTPTVSRRLGMYGNSEDIARYLKRAEEKYGKFKLRIHTKRYAGTTDIHLKSKI